MYLAILQSDQLYTWSDEYTIPATGCLAQTPHRSFAPIAPTRSHPARLPYRALQTLRQARMQMRRRPGARPQILSVCQLPGLAAANGLRAAGSLRADGGVSRQLSPRPRGPGSDLRDQPRTTASSRGALKSGYERAGCPPCPGRCGTGRRPPRQYACRLDRWQPRDFVHWGGNR